MNASTSDPVYYRDRGLEFLKKGKELFNKTEFETREKGYEVFKKGLDYMLQYAKLEKDQDFVKKVRENFANWMNEAKAMESTIQAERQKLNPSSNNQQGGNNSAPINYGQNNNTINYNQGGNNSYNPNNGNQNSNSNSGNNDQPSKKKAQIKEDDDAEKMSGALEGAIVQDKPNVKWEDIAGLEMAKKSLQEAVILPIKFPDLFVGMRTPWKGILLYGPPGTGKTYLAKACATEADSTFFSISSSDVISKYVGESEKLIKTLFKMAREKKPAIIFIDEIDSMLSARSDNENEATRRVKTEFLVQMQGVGHDDTGILVLGATNIPWGLDSAVRRRFEKRIYIPLPDLPAREALLSKQISKTPNQLDDDDIQMLAEKTEGYSCSDMNILIRDASFEPLRKAQNATHFKQTSTLPNGKPIYSPCPPSDPQGLKMKMLDLPGEQLVLPGVSLDDFMTAIMKSKTSVSIEDIKQHEEFTKNFGVEG